MLALILALGCTGGDTEYTGGEFQFYTYAVQDSCYGGAMESVFMPEGAATPQAFANLIYLPSVEEMTDGYQGSVKLQDPFSEMDVTVFGDATSMSVNDVGQDGVLLNEDLWSDCVGDIDFEIALTIDSATEVSGTAELITSNATGDTCDTEATYPCTITLTLQGELAE